jgi:hypothetical protein
MSIETQKRPSTELEKKLFMEIHSNIEEYHLLGYNAVQSVENQLMVDFQQTTRH